MADIGPWCADCIAREAELRRLRSALEETSKNVDLIAEVLWEHTRIGALRIGDEDIQLNPWDEVSESGRNQSRQEARLILGAMRRALTEDPPR